MDGLDHTHGADLHEILKLGASVAEAHCHSSHKSHIVQHQLFHRRLVACLRTLYQRDILCEAGVGAPRFRLRGGVDRFVLPAFVVLPVRFVSADRLAALG